MRTLASSPLVSPRAGLAGHIGVGHAYSHSGFMQEDSVGFAMVLEVLRRVCPMDFTIASVEVHGNTVSVTTEQGGQGSATAIRGYTPSERDMMQRVVGECCLAPQTLATRAFGRMYGQGANETASSFSLALSKAYVDTVRRCWPDATLYAQEDVLGCCGEFLGGMMSIDATPVAWLLSVNASEGGIGPVEDAEGTIPVGNKGKLMQELGIDMVPALILESKAYVPAMKEIVTENAFFARWNNEYDNPVVGACLVRALEESGLPFHADDEAYPRNASLASETRRIGELIAELGTAYSTTKSSHKKVLIAGELARIVSQDLGGSIFMSEAIFSYAGGGGLWPGHGAVLSLLATQEYAEAVISMIVTDEELAQSADISIETALLMAERYDEEIGRAHV